MMQKIESKFDEKLMDKLKDLHSYSTLYLISDEISISYLNNGYISFSSKKIQLILESQFNDFLLFTFTCIVNEKYPYFFEDVSIDIESISKKKWARMIFDTNKSKVNFIQIGQQKIRNCSVFGTYFDDFEFIDIDNHNHSIKLDIDLMVTFYFTSNAVLSIRGHDTFIVCHFYDSERLFDVNFNMRKGFFNEELYKLNPNFSLLSD